MVRTYHLVTFGCQMNKYDSEKIEGILASKGLVSTNSSSDADLVLVNTCSIREKAENKVFSFIGRLAREKARNSKRLIGLGGCIATLRKDSILESVPALDFVFGPDSIDKLPHLIDECLSTGQRKTEIEFTDNTSMWDSPESTLRKSAISGWVGIMKGCDNRCSYCVVPDTRGPEVSRPVDSILREVEELAESGYKEVNLLGQNVNSYGKTLPIPVSFSKLLKLVEQVDGIERVRFWTSHPKDLTDELIDVMAGSGKICSSLHLPIQAGSDRILEMMNRGYTTKEYMEKVNRLRSAVSGITISTDLMVAFPSETDDEFESTMDVIREGDFSSLYLFIYSPRPGTPAALHKQQLSRSVSSERFEKAHNLHKKLLSKKSEAMKGRIVEVLCEGQYNGRAVGVGDNMLFGRSEGNHPVIFKSPSDCKGKTVQVEVTDFSQFNLIGKTV